MPNKAHRDDYGGDCMTNPNGARWEQDAVRHNGSSRPSFADLARRSDGRWIPHTNESSTVDVGAAPHPATTELAVTRARDIHTNADWEVVNEYDPAFEAASDRFFDTDPGNRLTFDKLMDDDIGAEGIRPDPEPGHHDPQGGAERQGPVEQSYPVGSGYEAVYGDAVTGSDEPVADDDELVTGAAARRNAIEWAVVLVAAVLLALVLRALVLQAFYIPSPSMESTLLIQDRVLVNKLSYRFGDVGQGDIVVFHRTDEEIASAGPSQPKDVIKRVIALGGDTIEIRENKLIINGQEQVEPYLEPGLVMPDYGPLTVPEGFLFVMGDNRNLSSDSRGELGPIAEDRVVGRAFVLFWPVNRITRL